MCDRNFHLAFTKLLHDPVISEIWGRRILSNEYARSSRDACRPFAYSRYRPPNGVIVDHSLVISQLPVKTDSPSPSERLVRGWMRVDRDDLYDERCKSARCVPQFLPMLM